MSSARVCYKCGLLIWFRKKRSNVDGKFKWYPMNVDDKREHWDTCEREQARKALEESEARARKSARNNLSNLWVQADDARQAKVGKE